MPMSDRDVAKDFARRSEAYRGRMVALTTLEPRERRKRYFLNIGVLAGFTGSVALRWATLDVRIVLVLFAAAMVVRMVGSGFISVWAHSEIRRVKALYPIEGESTELGRK